MLRDPSTAGSLHCGIPIAQAHISVEEIKRGSFSWPPAVSLFVASAVALLVGPSGLLAAVLPQRSQFAFDNNLFFERRSAALVHQSWRWSGARFALRREVIVRRYCS